jgi:hypothetical protein
MAQFTNRHWSEKTAPAVWRSGSFNAATETPRILLRDHSESSMNSTQEIVVT